MMIIGMYDDYDDNDDNENDNSDNGGRSWRLREEGNGRMVD